MGKPREIIDIHIIELSSPITPNLNNGMPFLYLNPSEKSRQVINNLELIS